MVQGGVDSTSHQHFSGSGVAFIRYRSKYQPSILPEQSGITSNVWKHTWAQLCRRLTRLSVEGLQKYVRSPDLTVPDWDQTDALIAPANFTLSDKVEIMGLAGVAGGQINEQARM